jgi:hypothetical protein
MNLEKKYGRRARGAKVFCHTNATRQFICTRIDMPIPALTSLVVSKLEETEASKTVSVPRKKRAWRTSRAPELRL